MIQDLLPEIQVEKLPSFNVLYDLPKGTDIVVIIGGRGGAKSYEVSKFVAFSATVKKKRCLILRDEKELIRESILNEILLRFDTADANGDLSREYQRLDTGIKDRSTDQMCVFTKGFRASQTEKRANLKSISDIDIAVIEEAEDIRDVDKFNTFADSIRKEGALIIIILNTPDINHWVVKRYFTLETVKGADGFYEIKPKQLKGFLCIMTSYKDNPHLPPNIVERYEGYGNPDSYFYNPYYYYTAILGYASTGRKGQIFSGWKAITNAQFNDVDARSVFGLDFGLSSPAGVVEIKMEKNNIYIREHNYKPLTVKEIAILFCKIRVSDHAIIADSAEPHSISKLRRGWNVEELTEKELEQYSELITGFNIYPAVKGPGSILDGINLLMDSNVFVTQESVNVWAEYASYAWALDKNGNPTGDPEDDNNHLMDPIRYARKSKGRYF